MFCGIFRILVIAYQAISFWSISSGFHPDSDIPGSVSVVCVVAVAAFLVLSILVSICQIRSEKAIQVTV